MAAEVKQIVPETDLGQTGEQELDESEPSGVPSSRKWLQHQPGVLHPVPCIFPPVWWLLVARLVLLRNTAKLIKQTAFMLISTPGSIAVGL